MKYKKRTNLFIVDGDTSVANQLEEFSFDHPEEKINVLKKKTTKHGFTMGTDGRPDTIRKYWLRTDIFIFYASLADGSAIELVEILKSNEELRKKKIIFIVDAQTMHYVNLAKQTGVDKIFVKPFKLSELLKTINELRESE